MPGEALAAEHALRVGASLAKRLRKVAAATAVSKPDGSPVSVADYAVQAAVAELLASADPLFRLVAEEDSAALGTPQAARLLQAVVGALARDGPGTSERTVLEWIDRGRSEPSAEGRFWTLDPVDGTRGFLGRGAYAVALALIDHGQVVLGGLACPESDRRGEGSNPARQRAGFLALAVSGEGAWVTQLQGRVWRRMRVSARRDVTRARVLVSSDPVHLDPEFLRRVTDYLGLRGAPVRMDSQVKFPLVAAGSFDLILRLPRNRENQKIWDFAAAVRVVEEAGGVVTDLRGERLRFDAGIDLPNPGGLIASNGALHASALEAVGATGSSG